MTEFWKLLLSVISVGSCNSIDINAQSESLSCPTLLHVYDLISSEVEKDLSTLEDND